MQNEEYIKAINDWWEDQETGDPNNPDQVPNLHDHLLNVTGQASETDLKEVLEGMAGL